MFINFLVTRIRWLLLVAILGLIYLTNLAVSVAAVPNIQYWQMENGVRVYFVEAHELPMVDVRVTFDAGSARDAAQPGIAALTNGLLDQGAGNWSADELAEQIANIGAQLYNNSLRDMAIVGLRTLTQREILNAAADIFAAVITAPTFPQDAFEREQARTLTALEEEQQSPSTVASQAFFRAIYRDHPYAHPMLGTVQSVNQLSRNALIDFHRRYYVGNNAVLAIVGDIDRQQAEALAIRIFSKLPPGELPQPLPEVAKLSEPLTENIVFPTTQTHIILGQPTINRLSPDYFPMYLGNHILGGSGLVSRISEEIREKRGLSYSAYSEILTMRVAGPFVMNLQTRNEKAEEALKVLQQVLQEFINNGPTTEELIKAQQNITGGFALRLDSNRKVVEYLSVIGFYKLPLDYLDKFKTNVTAVTVEKIRDAFQRHINADQLAVIILGGK